jgi:hypothetical protein
MGTRGPLCDYAGFLRPDFMYQMLIALLECLLLGWGGCERELFRRINQALHCQ